MTAPRRKPESERLRVTAEFHISEPYASELIANPRASRFILTFGRLRMLRVERVRAKPKGKRP